MHLVHALRRVSIIVVVSIACLPSPVAGVRLVAVVATNRVGETRTFGAMRLLHGSSTT